MVSRFPIVVVGGSAGALTALKEVVTFLPAEFPAPVLVVIHTPADQPSYLPQVLGNAGALPARHAQDGETLRPGQIYVAPPDRHLLVRGSHLELSRGPRENLARPSIDVLFRSAADTGGPRVIGVLLSGMLNDGASGLWAIKALGGRAVVQHPEDAEYDSMPLSALRQVEADHVLKAADIGPRLLRLVGDLAGLEEADPAAADGKGSPSMDEQARKTPETPLLSGEDRRRLTLEVGIAAESDGFRAGVLNQGEPSVFTCPECHGVLVKIQEGRMLRFRCHTGHAYTAETLLSEVRESVEATLWTAVRVLDEQVMLLEHLGRHLADVEQEEQADLFREEARQTREWSQAVRQVTLRVGEARASARLDTA